MSTPRPRVTPFWLGLAVVAGLYLAFLAALLGSTAAYTTPHQLWLELKSPEIRHAIGLSLVTCTVSALFALLLAVPVGYLLSRGRFPAREWLDAALDIPIVLPPMVVGLCLLIFFQTAAGKMIEHAVAFTYTVAGVILAQFIIGAAFAVRTMRGVFDHLSSRPEDVAMTLGCSRGQAVWLVTLPAARRGMFAAFSIAWARGLGEFGPILVFAGATPMKTEVMSTSVFMHLSVGHLEAAVAVSMLMVAFGLAVLVAVRLAGEKL
jgi:molybdate transport system permease protein